MRPHGERISGGLGHAVYTDPDDANVLIKVPTLFRRLLEAGYRETAEDIAFAQEHFGPWIPDTRIEPDASSAYRIIQARIQEPRHVTVAALETETQLYEQLQHLLDENACVLSRHGKSLDVYGFAGLVQSTRHAVERRIRSLLGMTPPTRPPKLANILIGRAPSGTTDAIMAVDLSLLHCRQGTPLERLRSQSLVGLHRIMLQGQFGLRL